MADNQSFYLINIVNEKIEKIDNINNLDKKIFKRKDVVQKCLNKEQKTYNNHIISYFKDLDNNYKNKIKKIEDINKTSTYYGFGDLETAYNIAKINLLKEKSTNICYDDFKDIECKIYLSGLTVGSNLDELEQNYTFDETGQNVLDLITNHLNNSFDFDEKYKKKLKLYYHNLKFDIAFLFDDIMDICKQNINYEPVYIGDKNKPYQLKITNKHNKNEIIFLDSVKILTGTLEKITENNIRFKKDKSLLNEAMNIVRDITHIAKQDEIDYLKLDVLSLAETVITYFSNKDWHLTTSSFAFKTFKDELHNKNLMKYFNLDKNGFKYQNIIRRVKNYNYNCLYGTVQNDYNFILDFEKYYKGGQTFNNPKYQGTIVRNGKGVDVNSLYPYSLLNCKIPIIYNKKYSKLKRKYVNDIESEKNMYTFTKISEVHDFYPLINKLDNIPLFKIRHNYFLCFKFICTIELKNELTFSPVSKGFCTEVFEVEKMINNKSRGLKKARVEFSGTEYDLENWLLYYKITDVKLLEYFIFDILKGKDLQNFRDIMGNWVNLKNYYSQKETYNLLERDLYKLFMNGLTGKFGEKLRETETFINDNFELDEYFINYSQSKIKTRMLEVILSLISFSRLHMSKNILKVKDRFCYCDTDSIMIKDITDNELYKIFKIDSSELGYFDIEKDIKEGIFFKPKCYWYNNQNNLHGNYTIAGCKVSKNNKYSSAELVKGDKIVGKKILKVNLHKGILLLENDFIFTGDDETTNSLILKKIKDENEYLKDRFLVKTFEKGFSIKIEEVDLYDFDFSNFTIKNAKHEVEDKLKKKDGYVYEQKTNII